MSINKSSFKKFVGAAWSWVAVVLAMSMFSCAAVMPPNVSMNFQKADNITFTVIEGNAPIRDIRGEISRRGYSVNINRDPAAIDGVHGTYREAVVAARVNAMRSGARRSSRGASGRGVSTGTGFFINNDGTILTSAHVISGANKISVNIGGTNYDATVITQNESTDLAIIKIDYASNHYFSLSEFENEAIGNRVTVLGFPLASILGTDIRLTDGTISALNGINANPTYFQMSVPVQPGNSGGPVFNERFQVVGIVSSKLSEADMMRQTGTMPQNVNFAVKSDYAKLLGSRHFGSDNVIRSVNDATAATVQVIANPDLLESNDVQANAQSTETTRDSNRQPVSNIEVRVTYLYHPIDPLGQVHGYEVYGYTFMNIDFIDAETGEVVGRGTHIGDSRRNAHGIARTILTHMLNQMESGN